MVAKTLTLTTYGGENFNPNHLWWRKLRWFVTGTKFGGKSLTLTTYGGENLTLTTYGGENLDGL